MKLQTILLKAASKSSFISNTQQENPAIGLKVSDLDRTNTSSIILPCKIADKYSKTAEFMHIGATQKGLIKEYFDSKTCLDLTNMNFSSLRSTNTDELPTITF
ncbi:unnamed protein product, partial [Rotaria sordida]